MKKILLFMAFFAAGIAANAETIVTPDNEESSKDGGIVLGQGQDDNYHWTAHVYVGVDVPTGAPDGVDFAPFRSWEANLTIIQYDYTPKNWNTTFSAGLGFGWRSYTLKGHDHGFFKTGDVVNVLPALPNVEDFSSNIHTTSLSMPLLIKQKFGKNFGISVGAQLNWNYYGRIHYRYEQGDDDVDVYTKKIGQRPFTVDVLGIVHVAKGLGIYCKYSLMSVLKKDRGPEFKSLAFGIYF